ncbi:diguanylate cyclase domain-containing protein [Kangiella sediminilitoris]|uniref:diguanylate cyclase n=1 Tax=Kangiella sediminilitoris TaxID=1144748 RepID=A0A1B3BAU5_9GAMM|nr:diguanylate cyclase [Kangiella sediminilitoris]AOE49920.1 Putative periplasmic ligand-binding sensor protein [Kangiella sediminilitoris]
MKRKVYTAWIYAVSIIYFIIGIIVVENLVKSHSDTLEQEAKQEFVDRFLLVRSKIESSIFSDSYIANSLATILSADPDFGVGNFEELAKTSITKARYLRNISLAQGYDLTHVYPLAGNEKALGFNFKQSPSQFKTVEKARRTKSVVIAGPLTLVQGGKAIIARYPIFDDFPINNSFWGQVSVVLSIENIFRESGLEQLSSTYEVALKGLDGEGERGEVFWGIGDTFDKPDVISSIELPGGNWVMAAKNNKTHDAFHINSIHIYRILGHLVVLLTFISIVFLIRSYHLAREASIYDELTTLPNRRYGFQLLNNLNQNRRTQAPYAVIVIDLNGFKAVNDNHGHAAGDYVLKKISNMLVSSLRSTDICCRLGGDEFLIVLPRTESAAIVKNIVCKLKRNLSALKLQFNHQDLYISMSAGYAFYPGDSTEIEALLRKADHQMYQDKQQVRETQLST